MKKPTISAVIAVKNEEKNIKECLEGIKDWVDEIIVVDDYSVDNTKKIAKKFTNKVYSRKTAGNYRHNLNFGFSKATKDWILFIDADERIPEETKKEILEKITNSKFDGYAVKFKMYSFGRLLKSPFWENMRVVRLFKKGKGYYKKCVPHQLLTLESKMGQLKNPITHYICPTINDLVRKCNLYSSQYAYQIVKEGKGGLLNRKIKKVGLCNLLVEPILYIFFLFFWKQNYKDGFTGLIMSIILGHSLFLERAKVWELKRKQKNEQL